AVQSTEHNFPGPLTEKVEAEQKAATDQLSRSVTLDLARARTQGWRPLWDLDTVLMLDRAAPAAAPPGTAGPT
ncbi:hypothetical protein ACWC5I_24395, partial [Kitasatospora sp. NPDC001574]